MKIVLNNQTELEILAVNGRKQFYQGENRDTLEIQLTKGKYSFDELDRLFGNPENTEKLMLIDNEGEYIHEHYTIRVSMGISSVEISPETTEVPANTEERIAVVLAQKSYRERELEEMKKLLQELFAQKK